MATVSVFGRLRRFDWGLLLATGLLVIVSLAAIGSLKLNAPQADLTLFFRQLLFVAVGLAAMVAASLVDYRFFRSAAWLLYALGLVLLVSVLLFGTTIRGTRGWFAFFGQTFQPVEFVKVVLVIILSRLLADRFDERRPWRVLALTGLVALPMVVLVFRQQDLGSALILLAVWFCLLAFVRIPLRQLGIVLLIVALLGVVSWFVVLKEYQQERVLTFFNPNRDPLGVGYNLRQAKVAVGSGQVFGRGLGLGPQSQLNFLPVQETDFIFAVIAEELGFVGSLLVLGLYAFFFQRLFRLMRAATDDFASFLVGGIASLLFIQTVVNISMNIGLLPVAGLPLPLLSYGGSSLIATFVMIGLAESVALRSRQERVDADWSRPRSP